MPECECTTEKVAARLYVCLLYWFVGSFRLEFFFLLFFFDNLFLFLFLPFSSIFVTFFRLSFAIIINSESNFLQIGIIFIGLIRVPILYGLDDICGLVKPTKKTKTQSHIYTETSKNEHFFPAKTKPRSHQWIVFLFFTFAFIRKIEMIEGSGKEGDKRNRDLRKRERQQQERGIKTKEDC